MCHPLCHPLCRPGLFGNFACNALDMNFITLCWVHWSILPVLTLIIFGAYFVGLQLHKQNKYPINLGKCGQCPTRPPPRSTHVHMHTWRAPLARVWRSSMVACPLCAPAGRLERFDPTAAWEKTISAFHVIIFLMCVASYIRTAICPHGRYQGRQ